MSRLRYPLLFAFSAMIACGDGPTIPDGPSGGPPPPTISPSPVQVMVGEIVALRLEGAPQRLLVVWNSDNPEIATVASGGFVRGILAGQTHVTARAGDMTASVKVVVRNAR